MLPAVDGVVESARGTAVGPGGTAAPPDAHPVPDGNATNRVPGLGCGTDDGHPRPIPTPGASHPRDLLGRPLRDLRISVTDRCNFRCTYCMPKEIFGRDYVFLPHDQILTFEEIERVTRVFVELGTEKLRITGGEPSSAATCRTWSRCWRRSRGRAATST